MTVREFSETEVNPTEIGPVPMAIIKIDGDNTGAFLLTGNGVYGVMLNWVDLEFAYNVRLALDLPKYIWEEELYEYLKGDQENPPFLYIGIDRPA